MSSRPIIDRLQDRLWTMRAQRHALEIPIKATKANTAEAGSISGEMAWPRACGALADGLINSRRFRRLRAVLEVVETLGPCEGRHHAQQIRATGHSPWLDHPQFLSVASWGGPLRWPATLLGTPHSMAPTSLRYLSHALWLSDNGLVEKYASIAEIGVGYGGLIAMNALVSQARTTIVDLEDVARGAMTMLEENKLDHVGSPAPTTLPNTPFDCVISNYAFTELSTVLQDQMLTTFIAGSRHGMILSNACVFSKKIGGRSNEELLLALAEHGIKAHCHSTHPLLSPADHAYGSVLILW